MGADMAIIILLASGFQISYCGELIEIEVKPYEFEQKTVKDAIECLNTEGGYSFIRKLNSDSDIIL